MSQEVKAQAIPLHCEQTKYAVFMNTVFFICPHCPPRFYRVGMMYPEPLEPVRDD